MNKREELLIMGKFKKEAKELLQYVGGKENINTLTHCVTRMRFVLIDPSKADIKAIEKMDVTRGTFTQAGQFQVVIGNSVGDFYDDFVEVSGIEGASKEAAKNIAKSNQTKFQRFMANLSEIFSPIIPAIVVGGLILGFRNVINDVNFFNNGTQALTDISQFWAGVHSFLWLIGEAIFVFLPVPLVYSVCKKMNVDQVLGIVLGITLVSPQLLNAGSVGTTANSDIPFWDFGFAQVDMIGYQSQVLPALLVGFVFAYLYRFFKKVTPEAIQIIVVPFFSLVPAVLLAHTLLGPIGWEIGNAISSVVVSGFDSSFGWLFGGIYGFIYPFLVITGFHHSMLPVDLQIIATTGSTFTFPIVAGSNIAQASATLGYLYLHKKNMDTKKVAIPAVISGYLGVTEPAMFGVNLQNVFPFVAAMIGSGIAGLFSTITNTLANSVGVGGIPAILSMQPESWMSFTVVMVISIVVPFIVTILFSRMPFFAKYDRNIETDDYEVPNTDKKNLELES